MLPAMIEVYRASVAQARGDMDGTVAARPARPATRPARRTTSPAAAPPASSAWRPGPPATSAPRSTRSAKRVASLRAAGDVTDELGATVVMASMWLARGRPTRHGVSTSGRSAAAEPRPAPVLSMTGDLHVGLADVLREQGELDAAAKHLQAAQELGDAASLLENRFRWYTATAGLLRARGDLDGAVAMLEQAEALYLPGVLPRHAPHPGLRRPAPHRPGSAGGRVGWAREHGVSADQDPTYLAEFDLLTLARLLLAQHRTTATGPRAARLLDRVLAAARGGRPRRQRRRSPTGPCPRPPGPRRLSAALDDLGRGPRQGVPAGYVRLFLDEGPADAELLRGRRPARPTGAEPRRARCAPAPGRGPARRSRPRGPMHRTGGDGLSARELEVLRLLASELTGPEIAQHLFVSVNTLRTHTKHIFTKLEVNTRRAAVRRGTELGLLCSRRRLPRSPPGHITW